MNLSEHFTQAELTISETAARRGINNTPDAKILANLKRLAGVLEQVRSMVGKPVNVTSGYRSPAVNKAIGGAVNSAHMYGLAADINVNGWTPKQLAVLIRDSNLQFDQVILEYDNWVHIGLSEDPPRNELLTIRTGTGYMKGIV
jgi:zinc D-Ala-D-Ala carboxypeptidase